MIRHVVVFTFAHHVTESQRQHLIDELDRLPSLFPAMRHWTRGANRSRRDDTYEHAFVVDFDTEDELVAYLDSDIHETFVAERWRPLVVRRAIVSFEVDAAADGGA